MAQSPSSLADALDPPDPGSPLVDLLTPPHVPEPDDDLGRLLAAGEADPSRVDVDGLRRLWRLKMAKAQHEASAKALGPDIAELERKLIEAHVGSEVLPPWHFADGPDNVEASVGGLLWPKKRTDPDTGQDYDSTEVIAALHDAGLDEIVTESYHGQTFAKLVRDLVENWRAKVSESDGLRNTAGNLVDQYGNELGPDEIGDPTADDLALPPALRAVVTVSQSLGITFRVK